jgi:hypothetical protein
MRWLYDNRQWVFDGVGVAVLTGLWVTMRNRKRKAHPGSTMSSGVVIGEKSSVSGMVAGRDIKSVNSHGSTEDLHEQPKR